MMKVKDFFLKHRPLIAYLFAALLLLLWYTRPVTLSSVLRQEDVRSVDATLMDLYTISDKQEVFYDYHVRDLVVDAGSEGAIALLDTLETIPCRATIWGLFFPNNTLLSGRSGNINITLNTARKSVDLRMAEGDHYLHTTGKYSTAQGDIHRSFKTYKLDTEAYDTLAAVVRQYGVLREE